MTDIQLPLNPTTTNHQQKGGVINSGKLIAKASNLEMYRCFFILFILQNEHFEAGFKFRFN
jgi:hypothetical protein